MSLFARTAAIVCAAAAVCGAFAVTTTADAAPAHSEETVLAFSATLDDLHSTAIPDFTCPADHPWLVDQNLAPGRLVPPGVSVDEPGSIGVSVSTAHGDANNRTTGWQGDESSATNWDVHTHVVSVYGHCTNDPAQSYQPAG